MMDNMDLYNRFREVPPEAKKTIQAGKLRGFTDVNPMWRIKKLTEAFGPCGFGWYTEITNKWIEKGGDGRTSAFIEINLYVKDGEEWSKPIIGVGGSMFTNIFKGSLETSDEAFKMAYTDAISIACKALGMGADVYFEKDRTKYGLTDEATEDKPKPALEDKPEDEYATEEQVSKLNKYYEKNREAYLKVLEKFGATNAVQLNRLVAQSLIDRIEVAIAKKQAGK